MRKLFLLLMVIASAGMTGCGSAYIKRVDPAVMNTNISNNETAVVFFRPTSFGSQDTTFIFEIENENLKFVAFASSGVKTLHKTTPGKHLYLVSGGKPGYYNFMEANLAPGKTYYAYVSKRTSAASAALPIIAAGVFAPLLHTDIGNQYSFFPVTASDLSSEKFKKDFADCMWYENRKHIEENGFEKYYTELIKGYSTLKPEEKILVRREYGTNIPIL